MELDNNPRTMGEWPALGIRHVNDGFMWEHDDDASSTHTIETVLDMAQERVNSKIASLVFAHDILKEKDDIKRALLLLNESTPTRLLLDQLNKDKNSAAHHIKELLALIFESGRFNHEGIGLSESYTIGLAKDFLSKKGMI